MGMQGRARGMDHDDEGRFGGVAEAGRQAGFSVEVIVLAAFQAWLICVPTT
jgi:hypothetical protein